MRLDDLSGRQYGKFDVICRVENIAGKTHWMCQCKCGKIKSVRGTHLKTGRVVSCGCNRDEKLSVTRTTHGKSRTRVYRIWQCMINRCHYEKYHEWEYYGGRGITVCARWRESFANFYADMGDPAPHLSIDRYPNTDGNYEPGNCRWATAVEQARNKRK